VILPIQPAVVAQPAVLTETHPAVGTQAALVVCGGGQPYFVHIEAVEGDTQQHSYGSAAVALAPVLLFADRDAQLA